MTEATYKDLEIMDQVISALYVQFSLKVTYKLKLIKDQFFFEEFYVDGVPVNVNYSNQESYGSLYEKFKKYAVIS